MLVPRIIPCLDVDGGRVVKGVRFQNLRDAGDPVACALAYQAQGADELVMLDVSATIQQRANATDCVRAVRAALSIPLTVGGGVRSVADAEALLAAGADKVAVNSAAVARPELIGELARRFGRQCTVLAVDVTRGRAGGEGREKGREPGGSESRSVEAPSWSVLVRSGSEASGLDALDWIRRATRLGAGEVLLTSFDRDGTGEGYDLELLERVGCAVSVPVIASGGARDARDLAAGLRAGADAVLLASSLHDGRTTVDELKRELCAAGVEVRP